MQEASLLLRLSARSEQFSNQCNLGTHICFVSSLHLPFPDHVHHLEPYKGSPRCLEREETHSRLRQAFDEAVILFNQIIEIFDLP
ncbi:MAG: hypothetical protein NVSMB49_19270 [Ktedonobacteraceae bacterium]